MKRLPAAYRSVLLSDLGLAMCASQDPSISAEEIFQRTHNLKKGLRGQIKAEMMKPNWEKADLDAAKVCQAHELTDANPACQAATGPGFGSGYA